jgi:uncharacterized glyoxalase superfamily protein PhnB
MQNEVMHNRSVPVDGVLPHLIYRDVAAAIVWLDAAFGFEEHYRYGPLDAPQGAQIHLGDAWVMLASAREERPGPAQLGGSPQYLTVFVPDVTAHEERAVAAGARIVEALNEPIYGERQYAALDLEGHRWLFSQHIRDADPAEWGAIVASR